MPPTPLPRQPSQRRNRAETAQSDSENRQSFEDNYFWNNIHEASLRQTMCLITMAQYKVESHLNPSKRRWCGSNIIFSDWMDFLTDKKER